MSRDVWAKKKAIATSDNGWAEHGGYMSAKVSKLDEQFKLDAPREKQKQGVCSAIFNGVAIYVNGYTDPSADELRRLMMLHGGQFHVYYSRSKTTHIIANNLPNNKIQALKGEKVMRPEWIMDSVKAGFLLPQLKYQLYTNIKGSLFPVTSNRQPSEMAGPAQKPHSSSTNQINTSPTLSRNQHYQGNIQPQSTKHSSAASFTHPQPSCSASSPDPRHRGSSHTHLLSNPSSTKNLQSTPHTNLQQQERGGQSQQPQADSSCNSGCREVELKLNGFLKSSNGAKKCRIKTNEAPECGKGLYPPAVKAAPLTNGHIHLVNGALKPQDRSPVTGELSADNKLPKCSTKTPEVRPPAHSHTNHDPYEFPHSPPAESKQSGSQDANMLGLKPPCNHQNVDRTSVANSEKTPLSFSISHSPLQLNGRHHKTFSTDPASCNSVKETSKLDPSFDKPSTLPSPSPSKSLTKSTAQPRSRTDDLISEYYSHSRLHQISTWRTGFSEYVNELHGKIKAARDASFPGKERLRKSLLPHISDSQGEATMGVKTCIFHVDMDCFFVSVGIRHRPDLRGKPVAVTSNRGQGRVPLRPGANPQVEQQYYQRKHNGHPQPERGEDDLYRTPSQESPESHSNGVDQDAASLSMAEIASCSYEARQAGVRNGMFFGKAKQLCPSLQAVPYDFEAYKEVALTMYETLASYTHDIEALSCDELLIDASALLAELDIGAEDLATAIRADIREKTGCCASVGMGSNILLARLATRKAKPDGQYFLKSEEVDDFINDLPVTSLPGVGPVMGKKLAAMCVRSCGELQQVTLNQLQKKFGPRTGQTLFRFCRGLDDRPVRYEKERKSVSAEMNYNIRFTTMDEAESFLTNLSMEVQRRLQEAGLKGRRVTLKVMVRKPGAPVEPAKYGGHGICDNLARTVMLAHSTDSGLLIASAIIKLFHAMKLQVPDLRGVGIQVQLLEGAEPPSRGKGTRSILDMLAGHGQSVQTQERASSTLQEKALSTTAPSSPSPPHPPPSPEPVPGTSRDHLLDCRQTPKHCRTRLNFSIEVPSPSQVDRSVLEALPPEIRAQVEQTWAIRDMIPNGHRSPSPHTSHCVPPPLPPAPPSPPALNPPPGGTLILQIPDQPDGPGIVLELPHFSQVDPDVFAALPKELQDELTSAYNRTTVQPQSKMSEQTNPLLQLKQPPAAPLKRRYKRKHVASPAKKGPSPVKRHPPTNSPFKIQPPPQTSSEPSNRVGTDGVPSAVSSKPELPESQHQLIPRSAPVLAGAYELTDIKTLLREWVTTITDPMEEDILQVVRFCTELIEDKDLEKLDLVIKYMKRLMQQSVESVWSMAFDFIVDNVQVVVQQMYGSTLKIT